jgi:ABC-type uncharacterized transport system substrate-binding protein
MEEAAMTRYLLGLLVTLALIILVAPLATAAPPVYRIGRLSAGSPPPDPLSSRRYAPSAMWRGTTSAWRSAIEAQPAGNVPTIGFLFGGTIAQRPQVEGFLEGLRELGYVEGWNILIERREARGRVERLPDLAAELVTLNPAVIVAVTTPSAAAAQKATRTIPIVMVVVTNPVGAGFVNSLAHPGGNITGISTNSDELSGKRLQLLKELVPSASRVAILWNTANPANVASMKQTENAAKALALRVHSLGFREPSDLQDPLASASREGVEALVVVGDAAAFDHRASIIRFAAAHRLPAIYTYPEEAQDGGLASYGPNLCEHYRRAAAYVDKMLKGANPAELPVEQPMKFELVINLKTAQELGLTIPPLLLFQADELIR